MKPYVSLDDFCEQLRLKLSDEDDEAWLQYPRYAIAQGLMIPEWCKGPRGPTPSESWGQRLQREEKLNDIARYFRSCDRACVEHEQ